MTARTGADARWLTSRNGRCYNRPSGPVSGIAHLMPFFVLPSGGISAPMTASVRRAVRLEHRLTHPNASLADLDAAVALAVEHDLAALTVNPWLVKAAKRTLGRSRVALGTVVGYPHGEPAAERQGVRGVEGARAGGDPDRLRAQRRRARIGGRRGRLQRHARRHRHGALRAGRRRRHRRAPSRMTEELVRRACHLAGARRRRSRRDQRRAAPRASGTVARTRVLRDSVGPRIGVKASGRFRSARAAHRRRGGRRDPRVDAAHVGTRARRRPRSRARRGRRTERTGGVD